MSAQTTIETIAPSSGVQPRPVTLRGDLVAHLPSLRAHALRLCRNRSGADDLVQATVLRALHFESTFREGSNLRAWLHQILHSVFVAGYRRSRRERRALERFGVDPCSWVRDKAQAVPQVLSPKVQSALAELPEPFAQVVRAVDLDGQAYHDAARAAGVPVGTVMSRLFRGRRRLRAALGEGEFTPQAA